MPQVLHYEKVRCKSDFHNGTVVAAVPMDRVTSMRFRLRALRLDRGLTQVQVAQRLGISVGLYNQLESGKRRMNETYMDGLAVIYGIRPQDLIEGPSDPLLSELERTFAQLTPDERRMLVASARGLLAGRDRT